jgi:CRP-like cAMP-binding protein
VKLIRHTLDGQERVLDLLMPGDFFGTLPVMGETTYPDTAQAHTFCCVLSISAQDFQTILARYPAVSLSLLEIVSDRLRAARELLHESTAAPVESRIASLLLRLAERAGEERDEGWLIQMPLARQDIADMLGITVETASRALSQFRKDGVIRSGRRWIAIVDRDRLAAIARQTA